jgi:uncharacterized membrane protein YcaP (DUF421 family)
MRPFDWKALWIPRWPLGEVALRAALVYAALQIVLRLAGRKELGGYSTFNAAVLILVTTTLRQAIVGDDTSITAGLVALGTIMGLDWLLAHASYRSRRVADIVEGPVIKLVAEGRPIPEALERTHVSLEDLKAALRARHGRDRIEDVAAAFLERSGAITFVLGPEGAAPDRQGTARPGGRGAS